MISTAPGKIITASGNIGVGKTWVCWQLAKTILASGQAVELFREPALDTDLFAQYYADPKRYAYPFQKYNLDRRVAIYQKALVARERGIIAVLDSWVGDDKVFALSNAKYFTAEQMAAYLSDYEEAIAMCSDSPPDHMLYLDAPPEVCEARIECRQRKGEENIPLPYLESLGQNYDTVRSEISTWAPFGSVHVEDWTVLPRKSYIKNMWANNMH